MGRRASAQAMAPVASRALAGIVTRTKAKLKAVARTAAKAPLRRLVVMSGTPWFGVAAVCRPVKGM